MVKPLCKCQFRGKIFLRDFCGNVVRQRSMISVVPLLQGKSDVQLTWGETWGKAVGWETVFWWGDTGSRIWTGHWIPASSKECVLYLTSDLSVKEVSKRRISLEGAITSHFFMNLFQISLTETSTEKCFSCGLLQSHPSYVRPCFLAQVA